MPEPGHTLSVVQRELQQKAAGPAQAAVTWPIGQWRRVRKRRMVWPVSKRGNGMTDKTNILAQLSDSLVARTLAAGQATVAVRSSSGWQVSGVLWGPDVVVTSEKSLPEHGDYEVAVPHQPAVSATVAGRDAGTNVAVLR